VGAGLVGQRVGRDLALDEAVEQCDGVDGHAHRNILAFFRVAESGVDGLVEIVDDLAEVLVVGAAGEFFAVDVGDQTGPAGERDGQRLGAAHPAAAGGDAQRPAEIAVEVLAAALGERLEGALEDALSADVDPRPGRHLAVHHEAPGAQVVEVFLGGPVGDEVGVGDHHPRGVGVRAHDADGLAGLDEQRLVRGELLKGRDDGVKGGPVAGGLPAPAVDHQGVRVLGNLRVEVVHEHAHRGLGLPGGAGFFGRARGADGAGAGGGGGHGVSLGWAETPR